MISPIGRRNLGISRYLAIVVAISVSLLSLGGLGISLVLADGRAETSPSVVTILGLFGTITTGLIAALKSTETADVASKTQDTVQMTQDIVSLTASQNATIQQVLMAHCGAICPLPSCGLRDRHITIMEGISRDP